MLMHIPDSDAPELTEILRDVIDCLQRDFPDILRDYISRLPSSENEQEFRSNLDDIRSIAIDWSRNGEQFGDWAGVRCKCVFCGDFFASKTGIETHLRGFGTGCPVMRAILHFERIKYAKSTGRKKDEEQSHHRRKENGSNLVLTDQYARPEPIGGAGLRRDKLAMRFAEVRLRELGFVMETLKVPGGKKVTSWSQEGEGFFLLADPRPEKRIVVRVWSDKEEGRYLMPKMKRAPSPLGEFHIQDRFKHGVREGLMRKVEVAIGKESGALAAYYAPVVIPDGDKVFDAESVSDAELLEVSKHMSRKKLLIRYGLTPREATRRIEAALNAAE